MSAAESEPMNLLALDPVDEFSPWQARNWARVCLTVRRLPAGLVDDVVLAVSELVTNSMRYVGGRVMVGLTVGPDDVELLVQDNGVLPFGRNGSDEGGRGLAIVAELAETAVCEQGATNKRITCTFPLKSEELAHV